MTSVGECHAGSRRAILLRLLALVGIVLLIWLPRGLHLDRLVTPDEPLWLARSANFTKALVDGNLDQTYQYSHPGVMTMWAGSVGYWAHVPDFASDGPDQVRQGGNRIAVALKELGYSALATLGAGRRVIVVFVTIALAGTAWYAIRLFGMWPGLIGAALLATDPFHIALSRLLHLDGLLSSLLGFAAVAWLAYLRDRHQVRHLVVAGIAVGLAGLTRSIAVVLLPMILISALIEGGGCERPWTNLWQRFKSVLILGALAAATFVALWPAMWSSPIGTIRKFVIDGLELGQRVHARPIFFAGKIYDGTDPGLLFYPVSFLWRTTPALLLGLGFAAIAAAAALAAMVRERRRPRDGRWAAYLALVALCVLLVLDLSEKKLDRYIIPAVPPLALVAGWGYGIAGRWLTTVLRSRSVMATRGAALVVLVAIVGGNLVSVARTHPYGLDYYNPALGGASAARDEMMIGWGEGLDQVGDAILALPDAENPRVITSSWQTSLDYFTGDATVEQFDFAESQVSLTEWLRADYYVWYITSDQRGYIPPEMQAYFAALPPVMTVELSGIRYAALYNLNDAPLPNYFAKQAWMADITPGLRLLTATLPAEPLLPGDEVTTLLYLTGLPETDRPVNVELSLVGPDGVSVAGEPQSVRVEAGETIWSVRRRIALPATASPGIYWVSAQFTDGAASHDIVLGSIVVQNETAPALEPTPEPEDEIIEEALVIG